MKRITGATVDPGLFGAGKDGFTEGVPGTKAATAVSKTFLNSVQEEICQCIEKVGVGLNVASNTQLYDAIGYQARRECSMRAIALGIANAVTRTAAVAASFRRIAYGDSANKIFVACTTGADSPHTSVTGITWVARSATSLNDVCYNQDIPRFLLVGPSAAIVTSDNGTSYTARTPAAAYGGTFHCCAVADTGFVIAGDTGEIQTSNDGIAWTHRAAAAAFTGSWRGATLSVGGTLVLVGFAAPDVNAIQTSTDNGVTWVSRTPSDLSGELRSVAAGNSDTESVIVAVGVAAIGGGGADRIMRSVDDGVTWTNAVLSSGFTDGLNTVVYTNDGFFVAVGNNGVIVISRDGEEWRQIDTGTYTSTLRGIASTDSMSVIVGDTSVLLQSLRSGGGKGWT